MAALTITATSVLPVNATGTRYTAGETITAGQVCYLHTDNKLYKADNATSAAKTTFKCIALNGGAVGQPIQGLDAPGNIIDIGATLAIGEVYCIGTTAGSIEPVGDLASTEYVTIIGVATAADRLYLHPYSSGIQHA